MQDHGLQETVSWRHMVLLLTAGGSVRDKGRCDLCSVQPSTLARLASFSAPTSPSTLTFTQQHRHDLHSKKAFGAIAFLAFLAFLPFRNRRYNATLHTNSSLRDDSPFNNSDDA
jgi:hypothetical protein